MTVTISLGMKVTLYFNFSITMQHAMLIYANNSIWKSLDSSFGGELISYPEAGGLSLLSNH